ncbi:FtsX-like permease family protein [Novipirellula galeiformis]|nr:FtsX-like permease family protein [Novipirellula galeiformis]
MEIEHETATARIPATSFGMKTMVIGSVRHSWRVSVCVAIGVATATAVIVGALLVGDSMRGSLRELTIERLGQTDSMVAPGHFFNSAEVTSRSVPGESMPAESVPGESTEAVALIFFPAGIVESQSKQGEIARRAGSVQLIGCDDNFWDLGVHAVRPDVLPSDDGVVLNQATATELGVTMGDLVTVRLPVEAAVPADSPLGRRDTQSEGLPRMKVLSIIPDRGLGRFSLAPSQAAPMNVYLRRATVAETLQRDGQANLLLFDSAVKQSDLTITLDALGLDLKQIKRSFPDNAEASAKGNLIFHYASLTSDQLLLPEKAVDAVINALGRARVTPVCTYLANAIERVDESGKVIASVPYSTITAIDSTAELPLNYSLPTTANRLPADSDNASQIVPLVLNDWTAKALQAEIGTPLRVAYYEPEVENGNEIERTFPAIVTDIVPITRPAKPYRRSREAVFDQPPTVYNDPDLTPTVPGVTDQDSISNWDLPFKLTREISSADDEYWNDFRLTPKAFLPLADGQRLFGSRFGQTTGLRIKAVADESDVQLEAKIHAALQPTFDDLGWSIHRIREQQLNASRGTTPFDALFLSLSFFVILAAVMLIAMLFRLGLTQRLKQFGTLLAIGWTPRRLGRLVLSEGGLIATIGVVLGIAAGIGYAMFVLWALRSWWVGAVTVPFLTFHWTLRSLAIGSLVSWIVAMTTLAVTVRSIVRVNVRSLLTGTDQDQTATASDQSGKPNRVSRLRWIAISIGIVAVGVAALGAQAGGQAAAGGFVGGGMLLLIAALTFVYSRLTQPRWSTSSHDATLGSYRSLATRNAARHPLRSTLTIGLMATAAFLIIAITAFRLRPTEAGSGGFDLVAQTAQPLYRDFANPRIRSELMGPDAAELSAALVAPMRMRAGQDASCNNLYQATSPTVLGVPASFAPLFSAHPDRLPGFEWAKFAKLDEGQSPWELLSSNAEGTPQDPIPVIIDLNTAMWSLQMQQGIGEIKAFEFDPGQPIYFKVVGLLSNTLLQGKLMIGEANFEKQFSNISGYRYFLIDSDAQTISKTAAVLENRLGDIGMDVSETETVLSSMMAVQNTYLRTFQSLGALGLLLGTVGLAIAQLRSVLERRGELAVMRAIGFTRQRLSAIVLQETAILLLIGIGCGSSCAMLAVLPYGWLSGINPPWIEPLLIVLGIVVFGLLAGLLAVRQVAKMPLLESLRGD